MQKIFKIAGVAVLCAATFSAHAEVAFDANLELDTTYLNKVQTTATNFRDGDLNLGGRVEVNAAGKATNGENFVAGRASLLLKKDGTTGVDDMWVQAGNGSADVKLGRFEAMDLFPVGKDTIIEFAGYTPYQGNLLRGRKGSNVFHAAMGLNAAPGLRVELGLVESKKVGEFKGVRPGLVYTSGALTLRAGVESVKMVGGGSSETGLALSAGYQVSKDFYFNANYAKKEDNQSFGLNAIIGSAGIGLISGKGLTPVEKATTVYVAYALPLLGVKGATVTPALSFAKGGAGTDNQVAARVRINYAF